MKKFFYFPFLLFLFCLQAWPQQDKMIKPVFNEEAAREAAKRISTKPAEQQEYYESLKRRYYQILNAQKRSIIGSPKEETLTDKLVTNTQSSSYCPNADFGNFNYGGWQGGVYTNTAGTNWTTFTPAWNLGIYTFGNNIPAQPAAPWSAPLPRQNRHTLLNILPTTNFPPANCIGWDSIAVGQNHISEIPFVPPLAKSGVTCRLGNANNDYETEQLVYSVNVTPQNTFFTYAFAVVLYDGSHGTGEQPFFSVSIKDGAGNIIPGCGQYQSDISMISADTSFKRASMYNAGTWTDGYLGNGQPNPNWWYYVYYRKWSTVNVDLTAYIGQNVTVEFRTADCTFGGHWGYAYVYADCGGNNMVQVNMCPGSTTQQLVAPMWFTSYQWYGPNLPTDTIAASSGGTNDTLFISNGTIGDTYTVECINYAGCMNTYTVALGLTGAQINSVYSSPSCSVGSSGSLTVTVSGSSNGTYNYQWYDSNGQPIGSNSSVLSGIPPGTYSVQVSSPGCGQDDTTAIVNITQPTVINYTKNYCGNYMFLTIPAGSTNIQWYDTAGVAIPGPQGNNDTLEINNPSPGDVIVVSYLNSGCVDSARITLQPLVNGAGNFSYLVKKHVCVGMNNGQAVLNLTPSVPAVPPYSFSINGPGGYIFNSLSAQTSYTLSNLAFGVYSVCVNDGVCFFNDSFKIDTLPVSVQVSVSPQVLCNGDTAVISLSYGNAAVIACQPTALICGASQNYSVGLYNTVNSSFSYPTPFGNFYTKMKAQYIYTAAELNAAGITAGRISSISFHVDVINGATVYPNFNISMGCTSQSSFNANAAITDLIPGLSNVYSSPAYSVVLGPNIFTFPQPYVWDGNSNIVVEVCFEFPGQYNYVLNSVVRSTTTTAYSSLTILSDTDPMCPVLTTNGFYWPSTATQKPDAVFGWCPTQANSSQFTYAWNTTAGLINPIQPPTFYSLPSSNTFYSLTITDTLTGCTKTDTFSVIIGSGGNLNVWPLLMQFPAPASSQPYSVCINGNYNMSNTLSWLSLSNSSGTGSGTYTASVLQNTGPPRVDTIIVTSGNQIQRIVVIQDTVSVVGVNNYSSLKEFELFPNPNNGKFYGRFSGFNNQKVKIEIYNVYGTKVLKEVFNPTDAGSTWESDTGLPSGIYLLRISAGAYLHAARFIIDK